MLISLVPLPSSKTLFVWKSSKKLNSSNISPFFKMQRRRAADLLGQENGQVL